MQDCPARTFDHPMRTPTFHHALRQCGGCERTGCVVPNCRRWRFVPTDPQEDWVDAPASGAARLAWRCRTCGVANSGFA